MNDNNMEDNKMSLPAIRIIDVANGNEAIDISELTRTALGSLVFECEELLGILKDTIASEGDGTKFVLWPCNVCKAQTPDCDIDKQHFPCFVE